MAHLDLKHAFRLIPVHPSQWHLLGYFFEQRFYFDVVLPVGFRSSPAIFNNLTDILEWAMNFYGRFADILQAWTIVSVPVQPFHPCVKLLLTYL